MTYLKGSPRRIIKSWYIGGGQEQKFRRCFAERLIFDKKKWFGQMLFFQFQSIIYRHAMRFHTENHLTVSLKIVQYLFQIRGCSAHDKLSQKRKIWDRECWPARNRNDHRNITNE